MDYKEYSEKYGFIKLKNEFKKALFEMAKTIEDRHKFIENSTYLKHVYKNRNK